MQPKIAPTSPAAKHDAVKRVWQHDGELQRPLRIPWASIVLLVLTQSLIFTLVAVVTLGWAVHRWPQSWLARLAPLTTTSTTVVQPTTDREPLAIPSPVKSSQDSAHMIFRNQGETGVYRPSDVTGLAWPLSSTGWLVTLTGAWPSEAKSLVVATTAGQPLAVGTTKADPATPFVFMKTSSITQQPLAFAPPTSLQAGQTVWVITGEAASKRQLLQLHYPRWISSDRLEATWALDGSVPAAIGAAVVDSNGRFVGLLGTDSRVWPVNGLSVAVSAIVKSGTVERPAAGFRAVDLRLAIVTGEPRASGWLVGGDETGQAVVPQGPADKAGVRAGDRIVALNDQPVTSDPWTMIQNAQPGDTLELTIDRQGKEFVVSVTLGTIRS